MTYGPYMFIYDPNILVSSGSSIFWLDWFKGKSTGNHGFYMFLPSNIGLSCKFSHHPILWSLNHLNPRCFYFYGVFPGKLSSSPRHGAELSDSEGMPFTLSFFLRLGKRSDPKNPCKMMQNVTAWFEHGENHGNFCQSSLQKIDDPVVWGATDFPTNPYETQKCWNFMWFPATSFSGNLLLRVHVSFRWPTKG